MITDQARATILNWASGKANIAKVFAIGDNLKNSKKGKALAIIAPSHLLHKIEYYKLFDNPNVDTMSVNRGFMVPGSQKSTYYLPLTVHGKTSPWNNSQIYLNWMRNFPGVVLHGMLHNDGTNPISPYKIASQNEVQDIVRKCPKTKFVIWYHAWGNYLQGGNMIQKMCHVPHYEKWTPSRIPWGHCGAISGFAIPLAMTLGYSRIYIVGMGYKHTVNSCVHEPWIPVAHQKGVGDPWLHAAPIRFKNQADLAKKHGISIRVGPAGLTESELKIFGTFNSITDIK